MRRSRTARGFTLLEVVLAIALSLGLIGAMLAFYKHAVDARAAVLEEVQIVAAERQIMDRLTDELRSAMAYPFLGLGMDGRTGELRFVSSVIPTPTVWVARRLDEDPPPPELDVRLISYRLRTFEDESGALQVEGLERVVLRAVTVAVVEEGAAAPPALLTPHIKFMDFRFWDGAGWHPQWSAPDLPAAVEITLGQKPLPEGTVAEDYPYEVFRRLVYVPAGGVGAGRFSGLPVGEP